MKKLFKSRRLNVFDWHLISLKKFSKKPLHVPWLPVERFLCVGVKWRQNNTTRLIYYDPPDAWWNLNWMDCLCSCDFLKVWDFIAPLHNFELPWMIKSTWERKEPKTIPREKKSHSFHVFLFPFYLLPMKFPEAEKLHKTMHEKQQICFCGSSLLPLIFTFILCHVFTLQVTKFSIIKFHNNLLNKMHMKEQKNIIIGNFSFSFLSRRAATHLSSKLFTSRCSLSFVLQLEPSATIADARVKFVYLNSILSKKTTFRFAWLLRVCIDKKIDKTVVQQKTMMWFFAIICG